MTDCELFKPNVTVAAIAEDNGRFLIVEEAISGRLLLNQPAGHLEKDESLLDAVVRETLEETAHVVSVSALTGIYQWVQPHNGKSILRFAFAVDVIGSDSSLELDEGIVDCFWMTRQAIEDRTERLRSPMILRSIDDYLAGRNYPLDIIQDLQDAPVLATD